MIDAGELGDVYHVRVSSWRLRLRPGHHYAPESAWFLNRSLAGGGVIIDVGVYAIDAALRMLGDPTILSVTAQLRQFTEEPPPTGVVQDVEDHAVIMLQATDGRSAVIETSWISNMAPPDSAVVLGTKAGLRLDPLTKITARKVAAGEYDPMVEAMGGQLGDLVYYRAAQEQLFPYPEFSVGRASEVTTQFLDGIGAGVQPQTPGHEALVITRIIDAAYRSAEAGRSVALADLAPHPAPATQVMR